MEVEGNIRFFQAASDQGAALRMGQNSERLSRFAQDKRSAPSGISLQSPEIAATPKPLNLPNQDQSSQFAADRQAAKQTTPQATQAMVPSFYRDISNLRQDGDQQDNAAADGLQDDMDAITQQNQPQNTNQSQEQLSGAQPAGSSREKMMSMAKGAGGNAKEELQKKVAKEMAKQLYALIMQALKDLGVGEPGYLATLVNSSTSIMSTIPGVVSLFYKDISEPVKMVFEGLGMPLTDYRTPIGILVGFQAMIIGLFWTVVVLIILPLAVVILALPYIAPLIGAGLFANWLWSFV